MSTEGYVFQRNDGRWCGKYKDNAGKWKYLYRKTKREAKAALAEALKDREDGITKTNQTVNAAVEAWLEETRSTVSYRTWINRESLYRNHIKNHTIGTKKLTLITPEDVRDFYRDKAKTLAPSTIKFLHHIINKAFRDCLKRKLLRSNPVSEAPTPKVPRRDVQVLTASQVKQLFESCRGDRLEGVFVLGACGLRVGEALSLRFEDYESRHGTMRIRRTLWQGRICDPKTLASNRTIKLPRFAVEWIERHAEMHGHPSDGWLFPTTNGTPVAAPNFWRWHWRPTLKRAGLPETLTYHTLRHGAASLMLNQNVPIPIVSRYLGHSSPATTIKTYSHMIPGMSGLAADGIDDALGQPPDARR